MVLEGPSCSTFLAKLLHRNFCTTESLFSVATGFFVLKCQYCESIWEGSGVKLMAGERSLQSCWETLLLHLKMLALCAYVPDGSLGGDCLYACWQRGLTGHCFKGFCGLWAKFSPWCWSCCLRILCIHCHHYVKIRVSCQGELRGCLWAEAKFLALFSFQLQGRSLK